MMCGVEGTAREGHQTETPLSQHAGLRDGDDGMEIFASTTRQQFLTNNQFIIMTLLSIRC